MKTDFFTAIVFLAAVAVAGCSTSERVFDPPREMSGRIMMVGNEPFTRLGLRVPGGKIFLVKCSGEMMRVLLDHQGKTAELEYDRIRETRFGFEIDVIAVRLMREDYEILRRQK